MLLAHRHVRMTSAYHTVAADLAGSTSFKASDAVGKLHMMQSRMVNASELPALAAALVESTAIKVEEVSDAALKVVVACVRVLSESNP